MEKMTVKEVIDKLANTKIYTRGRGIEIIEKIYPFIQELKCQLKEYGVFPFFELIKYEDNPMLFLKPYYSMHVFSSSNLKEITPEEILDIEFEDKKERVGRYRLEPVKGIEYYKGFHALEWVSDPTLKKKDTKDFEEEVEKAVGEDEKDLQRKLEFKD